MVALQSSRADKLRHCLSERHYLNVKLYDALSLTSSDVLLNSNLGSWLGISNSRLSGDMNHSTVHEQTKPQTLTVILVRCVFGVCRFRLPLHDISQSQRDGGHVMSSGQSARQEGVVR